MPIEIMSIDKMIVETLQNDPDVQAAFGFLGTGNPGNDPRFPSGATNANAVIFADIAPLSTPSPFIVFGTTSNVDINAVGGYRSIQDAVYFIKVCGSGNGYGPIKRHMDAVDNAIVNFDITLDTGNGVYVYRFLRHMVIKVSESVNNTTWYHLGGVYCTVTSGV